MEKSTRRTPSVDSRPRRNSLGQDDLYVDMTFAKVMDDKGWTRRARFRRLFKGTRYILAGQQ